MLGIDKTVQKRRKIERNINSHSRDRVLLLLWLSAHIRLAVDTSLEYNKPFLINNLLYTAYFAKQVKHKNVRKLLKLK